MAAASSDTFIDTRLRRTLVGLLAVGCLGSSLALIGFSSIGDPWSMIRALVAVVTTGGLLLATLRGGRLSAVGQMAAAMVLLLVGCTVCVRGVAALVLPLLVVVPVFVAFTSGPRSGRRWSALAGLVLLFAVVVPPLEPLRPVTLAQQIAGLVNVGIPLVIISSLSLFFASAARGAVCALEASNQAKTEFLRTMSHEVQTPLNHMVGLASVLEDMAESNEGQVLSAQISESGMALSDLFRGLLEFTQIEGGGVELLPADCCPHQIAERVLQQAERASSADLALHVRSVDSDLQLYLDGERLAQILDRIVNNAVRYTQDGEIVIRLWHEAHGREGAGALFISVTDTGCGVPTDAQSRIFEPFQQVQMGMARQHGGLGIGLAAARRLARAMGGDVWLEQSSSEGSTFVIRVAGRARGDKPVRSERKAA